MIDKLYPLFPIKTFKSQTFYTVFPIVTGIVTFIIYLQIAWFILPPKTLWSPDEGPKFLQLTNLRIEKGHLAQDIVYPGKDIDPHLHFAQADPQWGFIRIRNEKQYFQRLPIFPAISLPFHKLFGMFGIYILPALGGALLGVFALGLLPPTDRRIAMWILIALGSPVFVYAVIFWEHTVASGVAMSGAWLGVQIGDIRRKAPIKKIFGWLTVGALFGLAIIMRLEIAFFAAAFLFSYWFIKKEGRWVAMARFLSQAHQWPLTRLSIHPAYQGSSLLTGRR